MADTPKQKSDFESEAEQAQQGFLGEFWYFLRNNKKWWITPILVVLLLVCALVVAGSTGGGPFIYIFY